MVVLRIALLLSLLVSASAADSGAVTVTAKAIVLRDPIYFEVGKPVIKAASYALLDEVAATLKAQPKIAFVEIAGHTDDRGSATFNRSISDQRAQAVRKYLVDKGVDAKRLRAKGYGESRPIDKGNNEKAWARNRRIDFVILQRKL